MPIEPDALKMTAFARACAEPNIDRAIDEARDRLSQHKTGIEIETAFLTALERQKRVIAEAGRLCPDGLIQRAPLHAWAAALMQADAIIDAEDSVSSMKPPNHDET